MRTFGDLSAPETIIPHVDGKYAWAFESKAEQNVCVAKAAVTYTVWATLAHVYAPTAAIGVRRRFPSSFNRSRVEGNDAFSTSGQAKSLLSNCKLVMLGRRADANSMMNRKSSSPMF
jgi:hypothetical protein